MNLNKFEPKVYRSLYSEGRIDHWRRNNPTAVPEASGGERVEGVCLRAPCLKAKTFLLEINLGNYTKIDGSGDLAENPSDIL